MHKIKILNENKEIVFKKDIKNKKKKTETILKIKT